MTFNLIEIEPTPHPPSLKGGGRLSVSAKLLLGLVAGMFFASPTSWAVTPAKPHPLLMPLTPAPLSVPDQAHQQETPAKQPLIAPVTPVLPTVLPDDAKVDAPVTLRQPKAYDPTTAPHSTGLLDFDGFLNQVKQYHPKLYSADVLRRVAAAKVLEKEGAFDPSLSLGQEYLRYNSNTRIGTAREAYNYDATVNMLTRSGLKLQSGGMFYRGDTKSPDNPTGQAGAYFMGVQMPLLRGFLINEKSAALLQAELGVPLADAEYFETRLNLLMDASEAYWTWAAAERKRKVAVDLLEIAQFRWSAIRQRVASGDLPKIDAVEAELEVKRRDGLKVKAERDLQKAAYKLNLYLWKAGNQPDAVPTGDQAPTVFPLPSVFNDDDWMEARDSALQRRPELKNLQMQREIVEVDLRYAKNLRLPALDLFSYPGMDPGNQGIGLTMKTGISLLIPLRNRTARGLVQAARLKLQKIDFDNVTLLQKILIQVDDAYNALTTAFDRYQLAEQEYVLARQLEDGERQRFNLGDSTLFLVNQRERGAAEVAGRLIDVDAEYQQARIMLRLVAGQD